MKFRQLDGKENRLSFGSYRPVLTEIAQGALEEQATLDRIRNPQFVVPGKRMLVDQALADYGTQRAGRVQRMMEVDCAAAAGRHRREPARQCVQLRFPAYPVVLPAVMAWCLAGEGAGVTDARRAHADAGRVECNVADSVGSVDVVVLVGRPGSRRRPASMRPAGGLS
jgi:hypothetical protein